MKFTILLPIYQRKDLEGAFIEVIKSIYGNTLLPDQLIILIDGDLNPSFFKNVNKLKNIHNFEIYYPKLKLGLSKILNKGITLSRNDWIIRADGDDINLSNRFETLTKYMKEDYDLIGSKVIEYNKSKNVKIIKNIPYALTDIKKFSKVRNPFNHMSVAYKKNTLIEVGLYPDLYLKEDYGLWIKILSNKKYKIINLPEALVEVNASDEMYSRRGGLEYLKSELQLFFFKNKYKIHNPYEGIIILFIRTFFLIFPNFLKILIYRIILRKSY